MSVNYAIITFRSTGPIKSWAELSRAQVHNFREKPIDHALEDSPPPFVILGSNNLVGDVKKKLIEHGIDPNKLRENGVLAYEAVMTASPAFFTQSGEEERDKRLFEWVAAQMTFALDKYGKRVASMVLHRDEETPHVHMVIVPLQLVDDQRRKDRGWRWSLVGSSISGPGRFDQLQDAYAEAMTPFGLARGERGSGRKNEPYRAMMARVAGREKAATERERIALNTIDAAEQQRRIWMAMSTDAEERASLIDVKMATIEEKEAEVVRNREAVDAAARIVREKAGLAEEARLKNLKLSNELLRAWDEFNQEQAELDAERAKAKADRERCATKEAIVDDAMSRASAFAQAFKSIERHSLPRSIADALQAADALTASRNTTSTDRYAATASPRTVPLPTRQTNGPGMS